MRVLLDEKGGVYGADGGRLEEESLRPAEHGLLEMLRRNPAQHFLMWPFSQIVLLQAGSRVDSFTAHPSTFYPGTPFDTFTAVRQFTESGKVALPRMYLYPTSACNAACPICQFNFRRETPYAIPYPLLSEALDEFAASSQTLRAPSLIISGDGEPTLHPHLPKLLADGADRGMRIFLTSNLILPGKRRSDIIESISQHVSMLTVSIKGLDHDAYNKYQGFTSGRAFDRVLDNLQSVLERMGTMGRRAEALVGVASLVLPENTARYQGMLQWFADRGIDYVYLNLVEPSLERWGICFTDELQRSTMGAFATLDEYASGGMLIRYPRNPFRSCAKSVYYDATHRDQPDICGSALWNPIIVPAREDGRLLSCRNSDNFTKPEFTYASSLYGLSFDTVLSGATRNAVMAASSTCSSCRLERQVRMFDRLLTWERRSGGRGASVLEFDLERLLQNGPGGAIAFEDTFACAPPRPTAPRSRTM